ncbi:MAG TPA: NAD(P)/FAD-dependent oxidoreductase [Candidatus Deferrimicrobiaceae bacterium]|nr:NAD(P)/FAD-dependent oxidoreductase [Candidatus Deferrimicrobiaceae bacterium]
MERFDLVVIGAGAAGITAARTAADLGAKVALAERGPLGGLCVNRGCVPKKALVTAGRVHRLVREAGGFGTFSGAVRLDWDAVQRRQSEIVDTLRPAAPDLEKRGIRVAIGVARFADPHIVEVNGRELGAERFVIAAGSEPVIPDLAGRDLLISSDQLLFLPDFPASLTFIGAGPVALELAGAFNDFGARVTVLARDAEILPGVDADVARNLRKRMEQRGVTFRLNTTVTGLARSADGVRVAFDSAGLANEMTSRQVCAAVGRRFHPRTIGAARIGLEMGRLGLRTSPYLATSVPHIYAAGDAAGNRQLTPVAAHEGRIAAVNALRGDTERADEAVIPQVLFTTPELGLVGMSYGEAPAHGVHAAVARHDARGSSHSVATGEDAGYFKLVFDQGTQHLVGAQMVSPAAEELIQLCALAIRSRVPASLVEAQISVHPSRSERLLRAFGPEPDAASRAVAGAGVVESRP